MGDGQVAISKASAAGHVQPASSGEVDIDLAKLTVHVATLQKINASLISRNRIAHDLVPEKDQAETARVHLTEAIEALCQGFVLFDAEDRLVWCNSKCRMLCPDLADLITPGRTYSALLRGAVDRRVVALGKMKPERWIECAMARHRTRRAPITQALADGRWIQCSERQTRSGGTVGIYTDITGIKNSEQRRRKRELNAKSSQLRATLDNLVQGVSVFDHRHELAYWNRRFFELMGLPDNMVRTGLSFDAIVHCDSFRKAFPDAGLELDFVTWIRSLDRIRTFRAEYVRCDGLVVEVQRNVLPGGGFVSTYTDVTERRRAAEELEGIHRSLEKRVAERTVELTELNERLRLAKAAADDANLSKTRFLAAASHDLLQPLNAARLFVCALLDSDVPAELRRLTRGADNALRSVDELLTTLLEISKFDTGVVKAERSDFPVGALLDAMAFEFAMVAQKKGIVLRVVPCNDQIHSDMLLLRRILQNFVSNAIRYTTRGKVLIGCRHRAGWLSIEVWDTGPGIPQEHQQAVFGEFQRFEPAGASRTTGVGLGLAIAQRSAKILEHPLHVRSEVGKGSVFAVHVPRGRQARPASVDPGPAVVPTYGMGEATIVFIENDENTLEGMTALLTRWSCQVLPARTVDEAINRISGDDIHPDLVIADYHLDGSRTGLDAIASVRRHCNLPIPGIIVTADHAEALQDLVHKAGYELLQKPIKPAALRSLISHMLT